MPYTWTADEASASIDLPAPLALKPPDVSLRSQPGTRWLRLDGTITTGEGTGGPCNSPQGNIIADYLKLVVDGETLTPSGAPNAILGENESVEIDVYWQIPVDAASVEFHIQGRDRLTEPVPIDVPPLPAVDGD